jgi:hypothetical protein
LDINVVLSELPVGGEQREAFDLSLPYQQPVEWITVMRRKLAGAKGVGVQDGQGSNTVLRHPLGNEQGGRQRQVQPTERKLDRDFPCAGGEKVQRCQDRA